DQPQVRAPLWLDRAGARRARKVTEGFDARRDGRAVGRGEGGGALERLFFSNGWRLRSCRASGHPGSQTMGLRIWVPAFAGTNEDRGVIAALPPAGSADRRSVRAGAAVP